MKGHKCFRDLNIENGIIIWYCIKSNITKINLAFIGYIFPVICNISSLIITQLKFYTITVTQLSQEIR